MIRARAGEVSVAIDGLDGWLKEVTVAAVEAVKEPVEAISKEVFEEAKRRWPERTGVSRDQLGHTVEVTEQRVRGVIWQDAEYAYKIRFGEFKRRKSGHPNKPGVVVEKEPLAGQHVWTTLVRKPLEERQAELAQRISARWARVMVRS